MLFPKKVKHRKWQSQRSSPKKESRPETKGITVAFGSFGLKAETDKRITSNQIEAARRAMVRSGGKTAKFWIRVFPDKPLTKHGNENPMGSGKGAVDHYVAVIRPGTIIYEMDGIPKEAAQEALQSAAYKISSVCKFVSND
jgi:large subunit ribosomal protein L16